MAYCPSAQRLSAVIEKLCKDHGCTKHQGPIIQGPRGKVVPEYLRRVDDNQQKYLAQLPPEPSASALPSVIRSIVAQLGLDLHNTDFGVLTDLGDLDDDDDSGD